MKCIKLDAELLNEYNTLQDLLKFVSAKSEDEISSFIKCLSKRLNFSGEEVLIKEGRNYLNWLPYITNAFTQTSEIDETYKRTS